MDAKRVSVESERHRLKVVHRLDILDTAPETIFDEAVKVAAVAMGTPMVALSIDDAERQWFKSSVGMTVQNAPRANAAFNHALDKESFVQIPDVLNDREFDMAPLVADHYKARFFAAVSVDAVGANVGALCILDTMPRTLTPGEIETFKSLGRQISLILELRWRRKLATSPSRRHVERLARQIGNLSDFDRALTNELRPALLYDTESLRFLAVNDSAVERYGWPRERFLQMHASDIRPPSEVAVFEAVAVSRGFKIGVGRRWTHRRADGTTFEVQTMSSELSIDDRPCRLVIATDVASRLYAEDSLHHSATHDSLTGLPNREQFFEKLESAIHADPANPPTLLYLDLDGFKLVNDSGGHTAGDGVLAAVATLLAGAVRDSDIVARLGGDEFAVICIDASEAEGILIAHRILQALGEPIFVNQHSYIVGASIGLARGRPESSPGSLVFDADNAAMEAKVRGRNQIVVYDDELRSRVSRRVKVSRELQLAIESDQLELHYQPIVGADGTTLHLEALVRWNHPTEGLMPPAEFIGIAENSGQIRPLGLWVARETSAFVRRLGEQGIDIRVSFNVSGRQLSETFLPELFGAIRSGGGRPGQLAIELTESAFSSEAVIKPIMRAARRAGIGVLIDDFGTGHSSLGRLATLNFDALKLDRAFISETSSEKGRKFTAAVVQLADSIGVPVIAEGVETEEQLATVIELGCAYIQGYLFSRPVPEAQAIAFIERGNPLAHRRDLATGRIG